MSKTKTADAGPETRRVVFTMGGKGGVGKTGFIVTLAEWFGTNHVPLTLLDLDTENKARGSFKHYFETAQKVNIQTPAGLDAFLDHLADGPRIILADMGAGSGQVTHDWFDTMYEDVAALGITFTAIGVVTSDPASVESVLGWASRLQDRVSYLIVENSIGPVADFTYWHDTEQARRFREQFHPVIILMGYRLPELENTARHHGVTLGAIAGRNTRVPILRKPSLTIRAQSYRRQLSAEFDAAKEHLLP
jgi:hypothetical protein